MTSEACEEAIYDLSLKHEKLLQALSKCDPEDELCPTESLKKIIARVEKTLDALKSRSVKLTDLGKFRIKVTIPKTSSKKPAHIVIRLDQMRTSKSLEVGNFIIIKPPTGSPFNTPRIVSRSTCVNYSYSFDLPDRTPRTIAFAKASDVEVTIWKFVPEMEIGKGHSVLLASAKAQVLPLCFSPVSSGPLEFKTPEGKKTQYVFEATLSTDEPLIPENGMCIDEQMELIRE